MRINYYLPFTAHTGGVAVIFEHVRILVEQGHDATLTVPSSELSVDWTSPDHLVGIDRADQMPDADVIVATASQSVPLVWQMPPSKGDKFYFVQGYESLWCGNVDWTYRLPMKKMVVSKWLQGIMSESFGHDSVVVHPAIDHETFRPTGSGGRTGRRVLVMDHVTRLIKGTWVAIQAVELARRKVPDLELIVFGAAPSENGFGRVAEWHRHPTSRQLAELYSSCDVFLYPTIADGFSLPPLEAMACGTAVITTNHAGTGDWASPDVCCVVPPHDVRATADALIEALTDDERRARIAEAGKSKASEFTRGRMARELSRAFSHPWA